MQTSQRQAIDLLDRQFTLAIDGLRSLTTSVPDHLLYRPTPSLTVGENILRSAGVVEQTCGGITTNLWDDPFEWTLPETLSTSSRILEYLSEVETAKRRAFASLAADDVLLKYIAVPWSDNCPVLELLLQTLARSTDYRGRAVATLKMLSDVSATGVIMSDS
ncbi:MAG TPA: hypothetical protein VI306_06155 [Pyrinomonadaceae bacterium]